MASRPRVGVIPILFVLSVAACGSSSNLSVDGSGKADANDGSASNTDAHAQVDCGAIALLPPTITVIDDATGSAICDPTFLVGPDGGPAGSTDGTAYVCDKSPDCTAPALDGGTTDCTFGLLALRQAHSVVVEVSKPGYDTAIVRVTGGTGACVPYVPASHSTVRLHPVVDASADGG
jgi:hypothetical protein